MDNTQNDSKQQLMDRHGKVYEVGTVLFREGEIVKRIWIINEGKVRLTKRVNRMEIEVEVLSGGDFCGELSLAKDGTQIVTATVIETANLLVFDAKQYEMMINTRGNIALSMLKRLVARLSSTQGRLATFQFRRPIGRVMMQLRTELNQAENEKKALIPSDMPLFLGIEESEFLSIIRKLQERQLIVLEENDHFHIPDRKEYDRYLNYLELKDRYESLD